MDKSIEPVPPQVRILPPNRRNGRRGSRPFMLDGEVQPPDEDDSDPSQTDQRPLGHATSDELGVRLDVTA